MFKKRLCAIILIVGMIGNIFMYTNASYNPAGEWYDDTGEEIEEEEDNESRYEVCDIENISGERYWLGWRKYHYAVVKESARKGENITFTYRYIDTTTIPPHEVERSHSAKALGYGLYSLDYNKHMLGLLYYISRHMTNTEDYITNIVDRTRVVYNEAGEPMEPECMKMKEACNYIALKILSTGYKSSYEEGEFKSFWENAFSEEHSIAITKYENAFYANAFANNAIRKLESMEFPFPNDSTKRAAINGMIFSIMEARYRNKNLKGKSNLQLNVAEGDLWPFLVYCRDIKRQGREGNYSYEYEWSNLDKIVDGAYQYMYYYDRQFNKETKGTMTVTSYLSTITDSDENEVEECDWESEYEELTGEEFPYISGVSLQNLYSNIANIRTVFKKSSENTSGVFGAEEIYDIESEVSFSEAMEEMKICMAETFGIEAWTGLSKYNMERSYIMAKNIVENEKVNSEYAYYNIGTNILDATPGLRGCEYILEDFQKVKLKEPLIKFNTSTGTRYNTSEDTDEDGVLDKSELTGVKDVDITYFVKKTVLSEIYGKNQKEVSSIEKDEAVSGVIANIYESRNSSELIGNQVNRREQAENYLCVENVNIAGTDNVTKFKNAKLMVTLYSYDSNPTFKDTDFDGVCDGYGYDELGNAINNHERNDDEPLNNEIKGDMMTSKDTIRDVKTHMDYRYFFMNNKMYYDELSTMSLMLCNAEENIDVNYSLNNLPELLKKIGMTNDIMDLDAEVNNSCKIHFVSATNDVEYTHNAGETPIKKKVKLVIVKSIESGLDSIADIGKNEAGNNHETFDELANKIYEKVKDDKTNVYWVVGYNTGGAVANVLSAKLIDENKIVYAYTFGSPYTVYNNSDSSSMQNPLETKYACIYNVVNDEDIYPYIPTNDTGFSMYGSQAVLNGNKATKLIDSIEGRHIEYVYDGNKRMRQRVQVFLSELFTDKNNLRTEYYQNLEKWPTVARRSHYDLLKEIYNSYERNGNAKTVLLKLRAKTYLKHNQDMAKKYIQFINQIDGLLTDTYLKGAKDTGIYYIISKTITPETITFTASNYDEKKEMLAIQNANVKTLTDDIFSFNQTEKVTLTMKEAIEKMAEWYVNHIATYQGEIQTWTIADYKKDLSRHQDEVKIYNYVTNVSFWDKTGYKEYSYLATNELNIDLGDGNVVSLSKPINEKSNDTIVIKAYEFPQLTNYMSVQEDLFTKHVENGTNIYKYPFPFCQSKDDPSAIGKNDFEYSNYVHEYQGAGDDCARFAFRVLEGVLGVGINTVAYSTKDANQFMDKDTAIKMSKYFDIYDAEKKTIVDDKGIEIQIKSFKDVGFKFQDGDMLVARKNDKSPNAEKGPNENDHIGFIKQIKEKVETETGEKTFKYSLGFSWGNVKNRLTSNVDPKVDGNYIYDGWSGISYSRLYRLK